MKLVSGLELELALLGKAFLSGILLTVFYDVIRVIRRMIPHGIVWISLEDFVYGIARKSDIFEDAAGNVTQEAIVLGFGTFLAAIIDFLLIECIFIMYAKSSRNN